MRAPFTPEKFIGLCSEMIGSGDLEIIKSIFSEKEEAYSLTQPTIKYWYRFNNGLRNELVKIRASRKHVPADKYLRPDLEYDVELAHIAMNIHRIPSLIEAERALDNEKWRYLEGLAQGHYFDIDVLIVYAYKLLILNRWDHIGQVNKESALKSISEINKGWMDRRE
jgi:hypothetical protein